MRIRDLREDNDFSQTDIAEVLHIAQSSYSQYERGTRQIPVSALVTLAKFYGTSVDYLLGLTDERDPYPPRDVRRK